MNEQLVLPSPNSAESNADRGARVALMIWDDQPGVDELIDARTPEFADAVVTGLASALASSPGVPCRAHVQRASGAAAWTLFPSTASSIRRAAC